MSQTTAELAKRIQLAKEAYYKGEPIMTDVEYNELYRELKRIDPSNPVLSMVAAPVEAGEAVALPIAMPSLDEVEEDALPRWLTKHPAQMYHISDKLDGISALWMPDGKLYTHGAGLKGRDISDFVPYIRGLVRSAVPIRGELIMKKNSTYIPPDKIARNIVAGVFARKGSFDRKLVNEVEFVAFDYLSNEMITPLDAFNKMKDMGFKVSPDILIDREEMTFEYLATYLEERQSESDYTLDGIVMVPNIPRNNTNIEIRNREAVSPKDKVSWKTRLTVDGEETTVTAVNWEVSAGGRIKPVVVFEPVKFPGAVVSQATGIHASYIRTNGIGKGAKIIVIRSKDVIPKILKVVQPVRPDMPTIPYEMKGFEAVVTEEIDEQRIAQLKKSLDKLGAKDVGPATVAYMFEAGLQSVGDIYRATREDFMSLLPRTGERAADKIWNGLRHGQDTWDELTFMVASNKFPELVGRNKLGALLAAFPNPDEWNIDEILDNKPFGISDGVVQQILDAMKSYKDWYNANVDGILVPHGERRLTNVTRQAVAEQPAAAGQPAAAAETGNGVRKPTIVLTHFRDDKLAEKYNVVENVTKAVDYVVYKGTLKPSGKTEKAEKYGIPVVEVSQLP
jgi:NAD-dependent DNA ligase